MPKDLRDIVNEAKQTQLQIPENHRNRFEDKLEGLHKSKRKNNFFFLKIAASVVLLISLGYYVINSKDISDPINENSKLEITSLGSISPEMQKVENYYLTAINYELASLEPSEENRQMVDNYLDKIGKLDADRKRLNKELSENGLKEKTVNALITNLQLQLQLLLQLKDEINELKMSKEIKNEESTI